MALDTFDISEIPMMTIYDAPTGPYPARVRIALNEKGLQSRVRFVRVRLGKGEHKEPEFIATKNYSGTVPVMELSDGTMLAESSAITEYIDALDGRPTLTGETPIERGLIHMMSRRAEIELLDPVSVYFHHGTPGLGPSVELYQNKDWGNHQRDKTIRGMFYFDSILRESHFIAGHRFSMADITLIAGMLFSDLVKLEVPAGCEALRAWYDAMKQRPSVATRIEMPGSA